MPEGMLTYDGERTEEIDERMQEIAAAALRAKYPTVQEITYTWKRHHQPDLWLLFVAGTTEEP